MLSLAVAASLESYSVKMRAHGLCRPACKVLCLITCLCVNCCGPANVSAASSEGDGLSDSVSGTFYFLESLKAAQHVVDMPPCWPAQACEQPPALSLPCSRRKFGRLNTIRAKAYLAQHQKIGERNSIPCPHLGQVPHRCPGLERCLDHCGVCIACQFFTAWCKDQHVTNN